MSDIDPSNLGPFEAIEARLMDEARAKIRRDLAEFARLAEAYPDAAKAIAEKLGLSAPVVAASQEPAKSIPIDTLKELIDLYLAPSNAAFHKLSHASKTHYQTVIGMIERQYGATLIANIDGSVLTNWYLGWKDGGKVAMSQSKMKMLQALVSFGASRDEKEHCARIFGLTQKMDIEAPRVRKECLTLEDANKIRAMAHEKNRPSLAVAQSFQSSADLKQKTVIGEWVPMSEPGISVVFAKGLKWVRGIRWDEIDQNLILTHVTDDKLIKRDLKKAPMVLQELDLIRAKNGGVLPSQGPVVVSEYDDLPWHAVEFRRWWRRLADWCEISKNVRNSDTRIKGKVGATDGVPMTENKSGVFE